MRSRINSTGRKKIPREKVVIRSKGGGGFDVDIDFSGIGLAPSGRIIVEAHRQSLTERFDFGTIATVQPVAELVLKQLEIEHATFRIKVIDPDGGRLIARADRLRPDNEGAGRRELLTVLIKDIGPEPWRTEIIADEPSLVLNDRIPAAATRITSDPAFQSLILPAAFRQVLHLLWARGEDIEPDEDTAASRWLTFVAALTGGDAPDWDETEKVLEWIDDACAAFAERHDFISIFKGVNYGDDKTAD
jgi:hypothetical protein